MRKSLFEYSKDKKGIKEKVVKEDKEKSSFNNFDESEIKKKIDGYSKLSEKDLVSELHKEISKQKKAGSFNVDQLESQLSNIRPMLSDKQKSNLENILKNLKQ